MNEVLFKAWASINIDSKILIKLKYNMPFAPSIKLKPLARTLREIINNIARTKGFERKKSLKYGISIIGRGVSIKVSSKIDEITMAVSLTLGLILLKISSIKVIRTVGNNAKTDILKRLKPAKSKTKTMIEKKMKKIDPPSLGVFPS